MFATAKCYRANVVRVLKSYKVIRGSMICRRQLCATATEPEQDDVIGGLQHSDSQLLSNYDAIVIGAGHNGLVSAAYLQKAGLNVCVLERRHLVGGAAVTEEIIPGFKFSRASYVLSLLRPQVLSDLELKKHGLKVYLRDPSSYTPMLQAESGTQLPLSLTIGLDSQENYRQIAKFSEKDAKAFEEYERQLNLVVDAIDPLLDVGPVHEASWTQGVSFGQTWKNWPSMKALLQTASQLKGSIPFFYEIMTAPATHVLNKWFESEPLKATLATDAVIGAMCSPQTPGSGYVLLHHVMGELEGVRGAWGYVHGGMGAVSLAMARSARSHGASIFTNKPVSSVMTSCEGKAEGVVLEDGTEIRAKMVLSNATPKVTFLDLMEKGVLEDKFVTDISAVDYTSPVTKINVAVNQLPNFVADPNGPDNQPLPHHGSTIHLNCEHTDLIHQAYLDAEAGKYSAKPVIEMTIPSSLDPSVAPPGCHVVQLFTQFTPYTLAGGQEWTEEKKNEYADCVFDDIERYAPGFKASVIGRDILTPPDLERVFGLTGGNIFHGAMSLHQLYFSRPLAATSDYRTPVGGLYLCGSGAHPGGGVMGAPGRLAALTALDDWKKKRL